MFSNKILLITGGTGTFGNAVLRRFLETDIITERLWRSLKYEEVYIRDYQDVSEGQHSMDNYFSFYNHERPHQSLNYLTSAEVYFKERLEGEEKDARSSLPKQITSDPKV